MNILITGFSGFVARHFLDYLDGVGVCYDVWGIDIREPEFDVEKYKNLRSVEFYLIDLLHADALNVFFSGHKPDYILHLAAFSSVAYSWKKPDKCFLNNSNLFLNLIDSAQKYCPECRILSVGSSEEYGNVKSDDLPLRENHPLNPISPYAVARVAQEQLSHIFYQSFHMNIIMTRSFNHIGLYQDTRFAIPSFIERICRIKSMGQKKGIIETGNIEIIKDYLDVRDVVRAYYILMTEGRPGEVYNVCSGRRMKLKDIIKQISEEIGIKTETKVNPDFVRPTDIMEIVGSYYKIESEFEWTPSITIENTIHEMVSFALVSA